MVTKPNTVNKKNIYIYILSKTEAHTSKQASNECLTEVGRHENKE